MIEGDRVRPIHDFAFRIRLKHECRGARIRSVVTVAALAVALLTATSPAASDETPWYWKPWRLTEAFDKNVVREVGEFTAKSECEAAALRAAHARYVEAFQLIHAHLGVAELRGPVVILPEEFEFGDNTIVSYKCYRDGPGSP